MAPVWQRPHAPVPWPPPHTPVTPGTLLDLPHEVLLQILQNLTPKKVLGAASCRKLRLVSRDPALWTFERLKAWRSVSLGTLPADIQAQPLVRALRFSRLVMEAVGDYKYAETRLASLYREPFADWEALPPAGRTLVEHAYWELAMCHVEHAWLAQGNEAAWLRCIWPHPAILRQATELFLRTPQNAHRIYIAPDSALHLTSSFLGHQPIANWKGNLRILFDNPDAVVPLISSLALCPEHAHVRNRIIFISMRHLTQKQALPLRRLSKHYVPALFNFVDNKSMRPLFPDP